MGATCAATKAEAANDFANNHSFSPGVAPIQTYEYTDSSEASFTVVRGKPTADLSSYESFSGELLLKISAQSGGISSSPPVPSQGVYTVMSPMIPGTAGVWTGDLIGNTTQGFTIATCGTPTTKGWSLTDQKIVLTRLPQYVPDLYLNGGPRHNIVLPDEFFTLNADQDITVETNLLWGFVKLSSSGGASRNYPQPTALGSAVAFGPSATVDFDKNSPGFDPSRSIDGTYKPVILLILRPVTYGTGTSVTYKLYINGTLVRSITGAVNSLVDARWAFSIKDLGKFSSIRPPDNNPSDSLNGWPTPSIRITATPTGGAVTIAAGTKLTDWVFNYAV